MEASMSAKSGYIYAQACLGRFYKDGERVQQDYHQSIVWYLKAAESLSVLQEYVSAVKWYLKAAEKGNNSAQHNVGAMYEMGRGVSQDYSKAMQWHIKAASQGNPTTSLNMGLLYHKGLGMEQGYGAALEWHLKAAELGEVTSQCNLAELRLGREVARDCTLGVLYRAGQGVPVDHYLAMDYFLKAAE
ncbi:hypothetical protein BGW39_001392 [Mortierella sp. 14UC]|nr:hypothetical protein BGW39_001392 [Mortierella sp. 14UC]